MNKTAIKERAGEVVYVVTDCLNQYFAGTWTPPVWTPSKETGHCVQCHGPDTATHRAHMWVQQGHMDCQLCHAGSHGVTSGVRHGSSWSY
ncbi:MAG: hypothetical protein WBM03_15290 [Steroidobacteraceae bacterium]